LHQQPIANRAFSSKINFLIFPLTKNWPVAQNGYEQLPQFTNIWLTYFFNSSGANLCLPRGDSQAKSFKSFHWCAKNIIFTLTSEEIAIFKNMIYFDIWGYIKPHYHYINHTREYIDRKWRKTEIGTWKLFYTVFNTLEKGRNSFLEEKNSTERQKHRYDIIDIKSIWTELTSKRTSSN
jgi:hypothetical protein